MVRRKISYRRFMLALASIIAFLLSLFFSLKSFTGYVVLQEVDAVGNWVSLGLFLIGLGLTYLAVWRR